MFNSHDGIWSCVYFCWNKVVQFTWFHFHTKKHFVHLFTSMSLTSFVVASFACFISWQSIHFRSIAGFSIFLPDAAHSPKTPACILHILFSTERIPMQNPIGKLTLKLFVFFNLKYSSKYIHADHSAHQWAPIVLCFALVCLAYRLRRGFTHSKS